LGKLEIRVQVRIMAAAPITRVPAGINRELHEVGKAQLSARSGSSAAGQSTEAFQVNGIGSLGNEICIQEILVSELVVGVVVDVLRKIVINSLKFSHILRITAAAGDLVVLDSGEFVVLHPEISFENLRRRGKPEEGGVSFGQ